uniref:Uncharacterized protein n=1 Tax=Timema cristinae TaxID=61476 RepID=A0A7R9D2R8_TIMCR|nr:unnamed protein product [Timema cristinae]
MCVVAPLSTHHTSSLLVNFAQRALTEDDVNVTISSATAWVCSDAIETCFSFAIFVTHFKTTLLVFCVPTAMAGNIIPAIATSNAIVAGLVVLHAFNVLQERLDRCKTVYVRLRPNPRGYVVVPEKVFVPPVKNCCVCSEKPTVGPKT